MLCSLRGARMPCRVQVRRVGAPCGGGGVQADDLAQGSGNARRSHRDHQAEGRACASAVDRVDPGRTGPCCHGPPPADDQRRGESVAYQVRSRAGSLVQRPRMFAQVSSPGLRGEVRVRGPLPRRASAVAHRAYLRPRAPLRSTGQSLPADRQQGARIACFGCVRMRCSELTLRRSTSCITSYAVPQHDANGHASCEMSGSHIVHGGCLAICSASTATRTCWALARRANATS